MAGKPPNWKCLKAEMQSRVRRVDYARGNGVSESSSPPPLCFTMSECKNSRVRIGLCTIKAKLLKLIDEVSNRYIAPYYF